MKVFVGCLMFCIGVLNAQTAEDYFNAGNSFFEEEKYSLAIFSYNLAIGSNAYNPIYYNKRAWANMQIKNYNEALMDFNSELELKPKHLNENALAGRITANMELGNFSDVVDDTSYLIKYHEDSFRSKFGINHLNRGKAFLYQGEVENACKDFHESVQRKMADGQKFIDKFCNSN